MHRLCFVVFLTVYATYVSCNLIREVMDDVTKDIPLPEAEAAVDSLAVIDVVEPAPMDFATPNKKCAAIGDFCTYHTECCTRTCLGYMKRCVSGSGLYFPDN